MTNENEAVEKKKHVTRLVSNDPDFVSVVDTCLVCFARIESWRKREPGISTRKFREAPSRYASCHVCAARHWEKWRVFKHRAESAWRGRLFSARNSKMLH